MPDFHTGNVLYMTGTAQVLIRRDAADVFPRSKLAVKTSIGAGRFVLRVSSFSGIHREWPPYNPLVQYVRREQKAQDRSLSTYSMHITKPLGLGVEITRRKLEEFLSWIPNNEVTE